MEQIKGPELSSTAAGIIFLIAGILMFCLSLLEFYASKLMKNSETTTKGGIIETTTKGGIIGLICGILNSDILAIIGGILGISKGGK